MKTKFFEGIEDNLDKISGHKNIEGIIRHSFWDKYDIPGKSFHVASHLVLENYKSKELWQYTKNHIHEYDEIDIIISLDDELSYKYELDNKEKIISSPTLIYIPAGVNHRAEVIRGTGIFICIHLDFYKNNK